MAEITLILTERQAQQLRAALRAAVAYRNQPAQLEQLALMGVESWQVIRPLNELHGVMTAAGVSYE